MKPKLNGELKIFLRGFWKHPLNVGTPFPSSKYLAEKIADKVFQDGNCRFVVELGSGTGRVTKALLEKLPKNGKLYCFEREEEYCDVLNEKFRDDMRFVLILGEDIKNFRRYIDREPDCVVSGLPLSSVGFDADFLNSVNGIKFVQYKIFGSRRFLERYFESVESEWVFRNPTPIVIYNCEGFKR